MRTRKGVLDVRPGRYRGVDGDDDMPFGVAFEPNSCIVAEDVVENDVDYNFVVGLDGTFSRSSRITHCQCSPHQEHMFLEAIDRVGSSHS
eukprot:scaffold6276_cov138-Cylindrotheca_fusiformis.AAC.21